MNTNRRIFKYTLYPYSQTIKVPAGTTVLSVINQRENLVLYVSVPEDNDPEVVKDLEIAIVGTGHTFSFDTVNDFTFLGTVSTFGGDLIWHVFYKDRGYFG